MRPSLNQIENHAFFTLNPCLPEEMPVETLNVAPSEDYLALFLGQNYSVDTFENTTKTNGMQSLSTLAHTGVPHLKKNLEFLEENIELKRLELEILSNLVLVQRWADYTSKYGVGFKLTNSLYGVLFNDTTILQEEPGFKAVAYWQAQYSSLKNENDIQHVKTIYSIENHPKFLEKKLHLLTNFKQFLTKMESQQKDFVQVPSYL